MDAKTTPPDDELAQRRSKGAGARIGGGPEDGQLHEWRERVGKPPIAFRSSSILYNG